jgi:hypothetical protein
MRRGANGVFGAQLQRVARDPRHAVARLHEDVTVRVSGGVERGMRREWGAEGRLHARVARGEPPVRELRFKIDFDPLPAGTPYVLEESRVQGAAAGARELYVVLEVGPVHRRGERDGGAERPAHARFQRAR